MALHHDLEWLWDQTNLFGVMLYTKGDLWCADVWVPPGIHLTVEDESSVRAVAKLREKVRDYNDRSETKVRP